MAAEETAILHKVRDHLTAKGFLVMRFNNGATKIAGGQRGKPSKENKGVSDLLACSPCGRFYALEIKKMGGKSSIEQRTFVEAVVARKGIAMILDHFDKDELDTMLQEAWEN